MLLNSLLYLLTYIFLFMAKNIFFGISFHHVTRIGIYQQKLCVVIPVIHMMIILIVIIRILICLKI